MQTMWSISYLGFPGGLGNSVTVLPANAEVKEAIYRKEVVEGNTAIVSVSFDNLGFVTYVGDSGGAYKWVLEGSPSDFSIKFSPSSGNLTSGNENTWLPLSSTQTFEVTNSTVGILTVYGTVEIRRNSDSVIASSAIVTLRAIVRSAETGGGGAPQPPNVIETAPDDRIPF